MEHEFPELNFQNYQNEFLEDWWSPKKLFIGTRQAGKTTLILSELNRFIRQNMKSLVLADTHATTQQISERYSERFGEIPNADFHTFSQIRDGFHRGSKYDTVLIDEGQRMELDRIKRLVGETECLFLRVCACKSMMNGGHVLMRDGSDYFDSVYRV